MKLDRDRIRNLLPGSDSTRPWYRIVNQADDRHALVRIYDEISWFGVTAEDFVADLDALDVDSIDVRINCPGGSVFDGIAIHNALTAHQAEITTTVEGLAASAASFIVQAGAKRVMARHAQMMVHNASGFAIGDADTMREMADLLDKQNHVIAGIYAERAGRDEQEFLDLMASTTWLTDDEAVEAGLADEVDRVASPKNAAPEPVRKPEPEAVDWAALFRETVTASYEEL